MAKKKNIPDEMRPNARNVKKAKKFQVDWEAIGSCEVKADTLEEAQEKFEADPEKYGAPLDAEIVDWGEDEDQDDEE